MTHFRRQKHEHIFPKMDLHDADLVVGTVGAQSFTDIVVTVPGADVGDFIHQAVQTTTVGPLDDLQLTSGVFTANTVVFRFTNPTGGGIDAGTVHLHFVMLHADEGNIIHLGSFSP